MPEERRQTDLEIKERLIKLEVLQQRDIDQADEWRGIFCKKIDSLIDTVNKLPCDKREGRWLSQAVQVKYMWGVLTFFIILEGVFITTLLAHIGK